jgi:hypothetical protein
MVNEHSLHIIWQDTQPTVAKTVKTFSTNIIFLDIILVMLLSETLSCLLPKTQRFGDWILSPSSGKTYSFAPNQQS